jgi:hypothetical protein
MGGHTAIEWLLDRALPSHAHTDEVASVGLLSAATSQGLSSHQTTTSDGIPVRHQPRACINEQRLEFFPRGVQING